MSDLCTYICPLAWIQNRPFPSFSFILSWGKAFMTNISGLAVLDNWLFICGGSYYGVPDTLTSCNKFDLNGYNANWQTSSSLPRGIKHHMMVTYEDSIYSVGGWYYLSGNIRVWS